MSPNTCPPCGGNCNQGRTCAARYPVLRETVPGQLLPVSADPVHSVSPVKTGVIAAAVVTLCLVLVLLLAGCGERQAVDGWDGVYTTGTPDKHGVVCYGGGSRTISCVKVQP